MSTIVDYSFVVIGGGIAATSAVETMKRLINQSNNQFNSRSNNRLINQSNTQSNTQSINASIALISSSSLVKRITRIDRLSDQRENVQFESVPLQSVNRSVNQLDNRSNHQSATQSNKQSNDQSSNESTSQSNSQSVNQSANQSNEGDLMVNCYHAIVDRVDTQQRLLYMRILTNQSIDHQPSTDRSTDRSVDQSTNQLIIRYNRLVICSGASPIAPPIEHDRVITLRDTHSVAQLKYMIDQSTNINQSIDSPISRRVVVVGNGGIALELVHELRNASYQSVSQPNEQNAQFNESVNQVGASNQSVNQSGEIVWVMKDSFIGATFLDRSSSAFLVPLLYPDRDPELIDAISQQIEANKALIQQQRSVNQSINQSIGHVPGSGVGPNWQRGLEHEDSVRPRHKLITQSISQSVSQSKLLFPSLDIHFNSMVRSINQSINQSIKVELTDGSSHDCDFVVWAAGVTPNVSFIPSDSECLIDQSDGGIVVDSTFHSTARYVYAAGDCCTINQAIDQSADELFFQMRLWAQARITGECAASSMYHDCLTGDQSTDQDRPAFFFPLFTHTTSVFGLKLVLLGLYNESKRDQSIYHKHLPPHECQVLMKVIPIQHIDQSTEQSLHQSSDQPNNNNQSERSVHHEYSQPSNNQQPTNQSINQSINSDAVFVKVLQCCGRLVGATLIGDTDIEETIENLMIDQIDMARFGDNWLNEQIDINDYFD